MSAQQINKLPQFQRGDNIGQTSVPAFENILKAEKMQKERKDRLKKKLKELLEDYKCNFSKLGHCEGGVAILKLLARKEEEFGSHTEDYKISRLKLWIPDTIVYNDLDSNHFWLYSNEACIVWRTDNFTPRIVHSKLANFCSPNELVAVYKFDHYNGPTKSKLFTAHDLSNGVQNLASSSSDKTRCTVQRYIKSIGSKAFKVRTVWKKDEPAYCFIVTNKAGYYEYDSTPDYSKYLVIPEIKPGACTIFKTNKGKQLCDTLPYVENIVKYFRGAFGADVLAIAADFIKDESGIWWLVNIKSCAFAEKIPEGRIKRLVNGEEVADMVSDQGGHAYKRPEGYQKIKLCRYCEQPFETEKLTKKMTLKMVIELDKHLKYRGYTWDWLDRSNHQFLDTSNLYEVHKVCKIW